MQEGQLTHFKTLIEDESLALQALKDKLTTPALFSLLQSQNSVTLDTDAWDRLVGYVLVQQQRTESEQAISYWSGSLNNSERAHDTTHEERLAVVWKVLLLGPHLKGARLKIWTNHYTFLWIFNIMDVSGRHAGWRLSLVDFQFDFVHLLDLNHEAADALLQLMNNGHDTADWNDALQVLTRIQLKNK